LLSLSVCIGCKEETNEYVSGKKKISHAPFQKARFVHVTPTPIQQADHQEEISAAGSLPHGVEEQNGPLNALSTSTLSNLSGPALLKSVKKSTPSSTNPHQSQKTSTPANPHQQNRFAAWPGGGKKAPASQPYKKAPASQPYKKAPTSQPYKKAATQQNPHQKNTVKKNPHATSQPTSQPSVPSTSGMIYGQIDLKPELAKKVKPGSVLFVIVRRYMSNGGKGMMIAATKQAGITSAKFPYRFVVKQTDAMMGAPLAGQVQVSARIDQDGDAISKQPGDLTGTSKQAVMVGTNPVSFTLDQSL
jgi:hypothetical protein